MTAVAVRADDVDDWVKSQMQARHVPAVSIAVIRNGVVVKTEGYGLPNMEHNVPAKADNVFKIGSTSKQFIAAGVMLLVQDGKIAVDEEVNKYLQEIPPTWQAITIRQLLTHTSGLAREAPGFEPYKIQPDIDVIKTAFPRSLNAKPGDAYDYSNLGYYVFGRSHPYSERKTMDALSEGACFCSAGDERNPSHQRRRPHPKPCRRLCVGKRQIRERRRTGWP